ncbi:MAG: hypothetical protein QGF49_06040, partial [Candidatus Marinimicrobia bacterium]|nr:hypothetical protein [Candidatus Neomarinimicrobiota bacterium]
TKINFSKLIILATSKHLFLFTNEANFLSKTPSFSFGYKEINFFEIGAGYVGKTYSNRFICITLNYSCNSPAGLPRRTQPGTYRRAWTAGSSRRGLSHQEAS